MAKITRYNGNLLPFAQNFTGGNRTIFGEVTQSNDITDNINNKFLQGWEATTDANTFPTKQDFNAVAYVSTVLASYLHQVGIPEWNGEQEYHENSFTNFNGVLYRCKTNNHISITDPSSDATNWEIVTGNFVSKTGNETISGIKTFTSSPIVPTPTDGTEVANKEYVDTALNAKLDITKSGLSLGSAANANPDTTEHTLIVTNFGNVPGPGYWYIRTQFYLNQTATSSHMQIAISYVSPLKMYIRNYVVGTGWSSWLEIGGAEQISKATAGLAVGSVGSYAFLLYNVEGGVINYGDIIAGSSLYYSGGNAQLISTGSYIYGGGGSGNPSGTWRAMGNVLTYAGQKPVTLFLRIA